MPSERNSSARGLPSAPSMAVSTSTGYLKFDMDLIRSIDQAPLQHRKMVALRYVGE